MKLEPFWWNSPFKRGSHGDRRGNCDLLQDAVAASENGANESISGLAEGGP